MTLKEQIMAVRESGAANMLDAGAAQVAANDMGLYDLVCFIEDDRKAYARFILTGDETLLRGR